MDNIFLQDPKYKFYDSPERELTRVSDLVEKYKKYKSKPKKNIVDKFFFHVLNELNVPRTKIAVKSFMYSTLGCDNPKDYMNLYAGILYVCLKHKNVYYIENLFKLFSKDKVDITYYNSFDNLEVKVPDYQSLHEYKIHIVVRGNSANINDMLEDRHLFPNARKHGGMRYIYKTSFYLDLKSHTMDYVTSVYDTDDITLTSTSNIISNVELNVNENTIENQSINIEKAYKPFLFNYINNTILINFYIILTALFDTLFNELGETIIDVPNKIGT